MLSTAHRGRPLLLVFSEGPSLDVSECVCAEENIDEIQYVGLCRRAAPASTGVLPGRGEFDQPLACA